ncbi:MAG: hypothetical protein VYC34_05520 [Planctomycetota bacterium]|nr:hypothetical protein [Planctomycetota bacterium]
MQGLQASLRMMLAHGMETVWRKTARLAHAARSAAKAMGLQPAATRPSDSVTSVFTPDESADEIRRVCREKHGVILAGGQDDWKGRVIRISHMGAVGDDELMAAFEAIADGLRSASHAAGISPDEGLEALHRALAEPAGATIR